MKTKRKNQELEIRVKKFCETCKSVDPITEDGFEWMDCMLELRRRKKKNG